MSWIAVVMFSRVSRIFFSSAENNQQQKWKNRIIYKCNTSSRAETFACGIYLLFCNVLDPLELAFPRLVYFEENVDGTMAGVNFQPIASKSSCGSFFLYFFLFSFESWRPESAQRLQVRCWRLSHVNGCFRRLECWLTQLWQFRPLRCTVSFCEAAYCKPPNIDFKNKSSIINRHTSSREFEIQEKRSIHRCSKARATVP